MPSKSLLLLLEAENALKLAEVAPEVRIDSLVHKAEECMEAAMKIRYGSRVVFNRTANGLLLIEELPQPMTFADFDREKFVRPR